MLEENQDDHFINWPQNIPLDPELKQVKKLVFDRYKFLMSVMPKGKTYLKTIMNT